MISRTRLLAALLGVAIVATVPATAQAGGLFVTDRGTRPLGRGFAYVAGADDVGALWYNPAGLAWAERQIFLDTTMTFFRADFTRVDGGGETLPTVDTEARPLPIPMLGITHDFGARDFNFAFGVMVPNVVELRWPDELPDGEPAPQRYSLHDLDGSAFAHIALAGTWSPTPELSVGLGLQLVAGRLRAVTTLSACDRAICTQPENPEFDSASELDVTIISPTATVGVTYASELVRVGASFALPHSLSGSASIRVRLPSAAVFDGASVDGDEADVTFPMPWILRGGVEVRPVKQLRIEGAVVIEGWGVQDEMLIEPNDVWLRDVVAIGDYQVGPMSIPREMNTVFSARLGAELGLLEEERLVVRTGAMYESASFDPEYLTPLTLDSQKLIVGLGASFEITDGFFIDASYGHVFMEDVTVENSRVPQVNPIRPPPQDEPPPDGPVYVGNGAYTMEADLFGIGIRWQFDSRPQPDGAEPEELEPEPEPAAPPPTAEEPPPPTEAPSPAPNDGIDPIEVDETDTRPWYERGNPQR